MKRFLAVFFIALGFSVALSAEPTAGAPQGTWLAAPFTDGQLPALFSDHDEAPASATSIRAVLFNDGRSGQALRLTYSVPDNDALGYQYAGFTVPLGDRSLQSFRSLSFWIRVTQGSLPALRIQLTSADKRRQSVGIYRELKGLGGDWKLVRVPLSKFAQLGPDQWAHMDELAFMITSGVGVVDVDQISFGAFAGEAAPKVPYPLKNPMDLPQGLGAWCYQSMTVNAANILAYNATAPEGRKIRYAFPWTGEIDFGGPQPVFTWEPDLALVLSRALNTSEVGVYPMIDGGSFGSDKVTDAQWDGLARKVAAAIDGEPRFAGVHFDLEPHMEELDQLFALVKRYSKKPVTAAVGQWQADTFKYLDLTVLMGYDYGNDPMTFGRTAEDMYGRFMVDARAAGAKAMIGVPLIATHEEYSGHKTSVAAPVQDSGHAMMDYLAQAHLALHAAVLDDDPSFVGISIWALHPQDGLHGPADKEWYYPTHINAQEWSWLTQPVR